MRATYWPSLLESVSYERSGLIDNEFEFPSSSKNWGYRYSNTSIFWKEMGRIPDGSFNGFTSVKLRLQTHFQKQTPSHWRAFNGLGKRVSNIICIVHSDAKEIIL